MRRLSLIALLFVPGMTGWTLAQVNRLYERNNVPNWTTAPGFAAEDFTFVRIQYDSMSPRGWGRGGGRWGRWFTDYPDSDLNFSYRLHELTSLKVNPHPKIMRLTDPDLTNYPFIYIVEPGGLVFRDEEVTALRKYLLNGGFLMVDDFWGVQEWNNFYHQIKRVFPNREPVKLDISHPIFHAVFDLKKKPQIPGIEVALRERPYGITWEREDAKQVDYRAMFDDKGRMMAIFCHNTDLGDGWEEEATSKWYFRTFSEPMAYPLGINIVFYAMTH